MITPSQTSDKKPTIIFIDDELAVLNAYQRILRPQSTVWNLEFFQDSAAAFAAIHELPVDVVVTDVSMPGLTGLEIVQRLQQQESTRHIPVIIVTGDHDRRLRSVALDIGAVDILNKPVDYDDLRARIGSSLRLKACYDELRSQNSILEERVQLRTRQLQRSRREIIERLGTAAEYRDTDTGFHVVRVARYSQVIARAMGLNPTLIETIFLAAPLHDIGKIAISDTILLKPGKLTEEERQVIQTHCEIGARILANNLNRARIESGKDEVSCLPCDDKVTDQLIEMAREIAISHHENWDGSGYPFGLRGEEIPLSGRIVAVADVFDALTTARPYKPAFFIDRAIEIIQKDVEKKFDPQVVAAFLKSIDEIQSIQKSLEDFSEQSVDSETTLPASNEALSVAPVEAHGELLLACEKG